MAILKNSLTTNNTKYLETKNGVKQLITCNTQYTLYQLILYQEKKVKVLSYDLYHHML